ncbi:MAG: hypothetical protein AUH81_01090 [Candidatus Rokubacteria bacterium 13_1_40CM_4_69_5]|nr:MAG: hypothetical protein AUH81_01090 [Candidatus Rokubacteria bacterium 13_1_40CM_4_69_5]
MPEPIITAFTVAHSITLLGSAYDLAPAGAWFPPFVETVIAASIVYMALENIVGPNLGRRWLVTGLFGLVHGFGFSYGLKENFQFAGRHLLVSLFSFNVGIEIGQILVLAVVLPALALLLRHVLVGRVGTIILSALAAHTGWHWMAERSHGARPLGGGHPPGDRRRSPRRAMGRRRVPPRAGGVVRGVAASDLRAPGVS